jgi:hypothetical protein
VCLPCGVPTLRLSIATCPLLVFQSPQNRPHPQQARDTLASAPAHTYTPRLRAYGLGAGAARKRRRKTLPLAALGTASMNATALICATAHT